MSKWTKGVEEYAKEMREFLINKNLEATEKNLLNGAKNWKEASEGGNYLIYDKDIAERLATPTEIKRTDNGRLRPNKSETWLECQARALYQASQIVLKERN